MMYDARLCNSASIPAFISNCALNSMSLSSLDGTRGETLIDYTMMPSRVNINQETTLSKDK